MMARVYQKEVYRLPLPRELLEDILTYCHWSSVRTSLWYLVASKFDIEALYRAKQMDDAYQYLASDDNDIHVVFSRYNPNYKEITDYVHHIETNQL